MKLRELGIARSEIVRIADEYIWNPRNKQILYAKMEGKTYEEIAESLCLSTQYVKEIFHASQKIIIEHCR
jgi:DNA-binding CsgD family transcriptional regulator